MGTPGRRDPDPPGEESVALRPAPARGVAQPPSAAAAAAQGSATVVKEITAADEELLLMLAARIGACVAACQGWKDAGDRIRAVLGDLQKQSRTMHADAVGAAASLKSVEQQLNW